MLAMESDMVSMMKRLSTFSKCSAKTIRPSPLATKGYYYVEDQEAIRCYMCQFIILLMQDLQGDDIDKKHRATFPNCPIHSGHSNNTSTEKCSPQSRGNKENIRPPFAAEHKKNTAASAACYDDVDGSFNESFQVLPESSQHYRPGHSFYQTLQAVTSREAKAHSPLERPSVNQNAEPVFSHQLGDVDDEIIQHENVAVNLATESTQIRETYPGTHPGENYMARYPEYATEDARLASFDVNRNFPKHRYLNPESLAKAGFYYLGPNDNVRCFCCDGGLKNFKPDDEPWKEHASWFPRCPFLMQHKDAAFIENSRMDNSVAVTPTPRNNPGQSTPAAINGPYHVDPREVKARMESPTVRVIIDMGYSLELIRQAIERRLATVGDDFENAQSLLEAIFALERPAPVQVPRQVSALQATSGPEEIHEMPLMQPIEHMRAPVHYTAPPPAPRDVPDSVSASGLRAPVYTAPPPAARDVSDNVSAANLLRSDDDEHFGAVGGSQAPQGSVEKSTAKQLKKAKKAKKQKGAAATAEEKEESIDQAGELATDPETRQLIDENGQLREARRCKVCLNEDVNTVFLPCGHLVCCSTCSPALTNCPVCRTLIRGTVKIFLT